MADELRPTEMNRRELLARTLAGTGAVAMGSKVFAAGPTPSIMSKQAGPFELPALPYPEGALEPYISARTLGFHHGKHHAAYVDKLNGLVKGTDLADLALEEVIRKVAGDDARKPVFNNAAQAWNHAFYWNSMRPKGGGPPSGRIAKRIEASFGSYDAFKEQFKKAAGGQFGSGWAWLVAEGEKLAILTTPNADLPLAQGKKALLTCDVWEHAYYLDYQNRRPDYVTAFLENLVDWEFAETNLG